MRKPNELTFISTPSIDTGSAEDNVVAVGSQLIQILRRVDAEQVASRWDDRANLHKEKLLGDRRAYGD